MSKIQTFDATATDLVDYDNPEEGGVNSGLEEFFRNSEVYKLATSPELREVLDGAMTGELPLDRPLEANQPKKLSEKALQTVLLSVGGYYTKREIAAISGFSYTYVTQLVRHPYARRILRIANAAAIGEFSSIDRRIKRKVPKMLKIIEGIAEDENVSSAVRAKVAFEWLEFAGQKPSQKVETKQERTETRRVEFIVSDERASLLTDAIKEARGIAAPKEEIQEAEIIEEEEDATGRTTYEHPELEEEGNEDASKVA